MNERLHATALLVLPLALSVACGNAEQAKIKEIQKQADDRVALADKAANEKIAAAQQQMDATKAQLEAALAKSKADAEGAIRDAQTSADEQAKAALQALTRARDAYKAEARLKFADLNKDTRDVSTKAAKTTGTVKTAINKTMQDIVKEQKDINRDISAFDAATLDTFQSLKAKVDQDLAKLKQKIQSIRARVQ